ncbi:HNH endonuclease [candidate division KSB1 bacterium]|nr:MAG: HNH endonuclease [candidate division KSB1 bacterium]
MLGGVNKGNKMASKRKSFSKRQRFEVFKRDSFKCQYCGAAAPEALLHVDHIKPLSKGGTNDIVNLITSCSKCNLGKSNIPLDDNAIITKSRNQLEELQERREQLEMMMEWHQSLQDLNSQIIQKIKEYWENLAPGWEINDNGLKSLRKLSREYALDEITKAMDIAADQYLKFDHAGKCTSDSWENSFKKISGICRTRKLAEKQPEIKELYYIRGILRNRIHGYYNHGLAFQLLKEAYNNGADIDKLNKVALEVYDWDDFVEALS